MHKFFTSSYDASIYLQQPNQNSGRDEILEVGKLYYGSIKDIARSLIKFNIDTLEIPSGSKIYLNLKSANAEEIPLEYTIYAYPISQSWQMGTGTRFDNISTKGVTWNYREGDTKVNWLGDTTTDGILPNFAPNSTGSYQGYGGIWYSNYSSSQNFSYSKADISMNVSGFLKAWVSGSIKNDGILLKLSAEFENNTKEYGIVRLFSKETHTIYQPKIRLGWDDQYFVTGSLTELIADNIKVGVSNFKKEYAVGSKPKIKIFGRELYPLKTFSNTLQSGNTKYLPKTTYYQIRDFNSDDIIIPFSEYSKVNCDTSGNYIILDLMNWEINRLYKLEFKIDVNGAIEYFDDGITFSVVS